MKRHKCHSPCHERIEIGKESEAKKYQKEVNQYGCKGCTIDQRSFPQNQGT